MDNANVNTTATNATTAKDSVEPNMTEEKREIDIEFDIAYANNARLEVSVWDLKIWFGQLEQHKGKAEVDWHTAITIPWMQAKVLLYYLAAHVVIHQAEAGFISVHPNVLPPKPNAPSDEELLQNPHAKEAYELLVSIHRQIFDS